MQTRPFTHCSPVFVTVAALCLLSLVVVSCSIQLIAPYDQKIDDGVSNLQKATAQFFTDVERKGGSQPTDYPSHTKFYDDAKVAILSILVRASAVAVNSQTVGELGILKVQFQKLEEQDRTLGIPAVTIPQFQSAFDRTFRALLTLEVAKKPAKPEGEAK